MLLAVVRSKRFHFGTEIWEELFNTLFTSLKLKQAIFELQDWGLIFNLGALGYVDSQYDFDDDIA